MVDNESGTLWQRWFNDPKIARDYSPVRAQRVGRIRYTGVRGMVLEMVLPIAEFAGGPVLVRLEYEHVLGAGYPVSTDACRSELGFDGPEHVATAGESSRITTQKVDAQANAGACASGDGPDERLAVTVGSCLIPGRGVKIVQGKGLTAPMPCAGKKIAAPTPIMMPTMSDKEDPAYADSLGQATYRLNGVLSGLDPVYVAGRQDLGHPFINLADRIP